MKIEAFPFSAWLYRIAVNGTNLFFRTKEKNSFIEI
jgi:DNA-directed RNA polymerase specialized sigma24 family protein